MRSITPVNALKLLQIILFDVAISLFVGLLVFEKANRWPVVIVIVPLLLFFNIKQIRREGGRRASTALPVVYGTGFLYGVLWTILSFEWWKLLIVPVPLLFLIYFHQRSKSAVQAGGPGPQ